MKDVTNQEIMQPCHVTAPQHWHLSSTGRGGIRSKSSSSDISSSLRGNDRNSLMSVGYLKLINF